MRLHRGIVLGLLVGVLFTAALAAPARAAAPSEAKKLYEQKCLYCHSGAAAERQRLEPAQWRRLIETMRARAPLLISRKEADVIFRYFVNERHQVRAAAARPRTSAPVPAPVPMSRVATPPLPSAPDERWCATLQSCCKAAEPPAEPEPEPEDTEAEERGPLLFADRCSKCHTLRRAYLRIDSVESGHALIERMRRKMGSGITSDDVALLDRFLRARIARSRPAADQ